MPASAPPSAEVIKNKTSSTFNKTPCQFQIRVCDHQLRRQHSVLISPTGSGKSLSFLMPFIWETSGICLLICPIQLLGNQHASHPALEQLGIEAINLTAETASDRVFKDIATGKYRLVIASPEYVEQDPRFRKYLWESASFRNKVTRVIFDEAHCVLDWGNFRPAYHRLSFIRPTLLHATFTALSATLSPAMVLELKKWLGLYDIEILRRSNDRQNIAPIVKKMQYSVTSLHDIAFLIPLGLTSESPAPPKFMLFMRSKQMCQKAGRFLRKRLPPELRGKVVWVHSDMNGHFNQRSMERLKAGDLYGVVCTDVAGMGIDIPDIDLVVQYQLSSKYCAVSQRFGRAGRDLTRKAKSVLIIEAKYFDDYKQALRERTEKARNTKANKRKAAEGLDEAELTPRAIRARHSDTSLTQPDEVAETEAVLAGPHPLSRATPPSTRNIKHGIATDVEPVMDQFINAHIRGFCRCTPGNRFFDNPVSIQEGSDNFCCHRCCPRPPLPADCCDVCNPKLAEFLSAMEPPPKTTRATPQKHIPDDDIDNWTKADHSLSQTLRDWRDQMARAHWGENHLFGGIGLLSNEQIQRLVGLARRQLLFHLTDLQRELKWYYMTEYGLHILEVIHKFYPAPAPALNIPAAPCRTFEEPSQPAGKLPRAPSTCSACHKVGHRMNSRVRELNPQNATPTRTSSPQTPTRNMASTQLHLPSPQLHHIASISTPQPRIELSVQYPIGPNSLSGSSYSSTARSRACTSAVSSSAPAVAPFLSPSTKSSSGPDQSFPGDANAAATPSAIAFDGGVGNIRPG
ncbi:unnamed protein product [Rhizoctonia solani]|uniref:DNA 3'-5' helicase n=1 Tax=Rhizoctonia solani TaxID=456999 RepID=A0A8H3B0X8_9AGAM|nr:unnamed protein product [Rhizoctonia solani]